MTFNDQNPTTIPEKVWALYRRYLNPSIAIWKSVSGSWQLFFATEFFREMTSIPKESYSARNRTGFAAELSNLACETCEIHSGMIFNSTNAGFALRDRSCTEYNSGINRCVSLVEFSGCQFLRFARIHWPVLCEKFAP